jgi:soluble lytic murein transglycosylase-like protein
MTKRDPDAMRPQPRRAAMLDDLDRLVRRAVALPLALPVLLLGGWGLGKAAAASLALPDDAPVRLASPPPSPLPLESMGRLMEGLREDGERTADYVALYREQVEPVEQSLRRRGVSHEVARKVAWPLVEHAYDHQLDPGLVLAVLLLESRGRPEATSPVGARGLMQVMPSWAGRWRACGRNLYAVEDNLCYGTNILAYYLRAARGNERTALLAYNGCVRGTNTPDCFSYPDRVQRLRLQLRREWDAGARLTPAMAE